MRRRAVSECGEEQDCGSDSNYVSTNTVPCGVTSDIECGLRRNHSSRIFFVILLKLKTIRPAGPELGSPLSPGMRATRLTLMFTFPSREKIVCDLAAENPPRRERGERRSTTTQKRETTTLKREEMGKKQHTRSTSLPPDGETKRWREREGGRRRGRREEKGARSGDEEKKLHHPKKEWRVSPKKEGSFHLFKKEKRSRINMFSKFC